MARPKNTRIRLIDSEIQFSMQDPDLVEVTRQLDHYGKAIGNFRPVFTEFWKYHQRSIMRNFAAEGRPDSWAPLQPATIADRLRRGYGAGPILQRSGSMMRGFYQKSSRTQYRVRNSRFYFAYHQDGAPDANIPARPMMVLLPQDQTQFTKLARQHLLGRS